MSYISVYPIANTTILRIYSERNEIDTTPEYQRLGGIWTLQKKQLLIDSILNDYDIPKIYFHDLGRENKRKTGTGYAVIDGRQRLEAIWDFIEGKFALADDFIYQDDNNICLRNLNYTDLSDKYPRIRIKFDSFVLPIIGVNADDIELIEDMFSRLNEAVPLNSAEKRNALGGDMVQIIRRVSQHEFFTKFVKFSNARYKHYEIAARILFVDYCVKNEQKIIDTKKEYLDNFVIKNKTNNASNKNLENRVISVLDILCYTFNEKDVLLGAQGNMVIYYLLNMIASQSHCLKLINREKLISFKEDLIKNRENALEDITSAKFDMLEYDKLSQQGTNDASNIRTRLKILLNYCNITSQINKTDISYLM